MGRDGGRDWYLGQERQKRKGEKGKEGERKRPEVGKAQLFKGKAANVSECAQEGLLVAAAEADPVRPLMQSLRLTFRDTETAPLTRQVLKHS